MWSDLANEVAEPSVAVSSGVTAPGTAVVMACWWSDRAKLVAVPSTAVSSGSIAPGVSAEIACWWSERAKVEATPSTAESSGSMVPGVPNPAMECWWSDLANAVADPSAAESPGVTAPGVPAAIACWWSPREYVVADPSAAASSGSIVPGVPADVHASPPAPSERTSWSAPVADVEPRSATSISSEPPSRWVLAWALRAWTWSERARLSAVPSAFDVPVATGVAVVTSCLWSARAGDVELPVAAVAFVTFTGAAGATRAWVWSERANAVATPSEAVSPIWI